MYPILLIILVNMTSKNLFYSNCILDIILVAVHE